MTRRSILFPVLALALACASIHTVSAQALVEVSPLDPEDEATVPPNPIFRVGVAGGDVAKLRFRITLRREGADTPAYTFDQRADPKQWWLAPFDEEMGVRCRVDPEQPLQEGVYYWNVAAWDGKAWIEGTSGRRLTVDAVPPAAVQNVRIRRNPEKGTMYLEWDPVTTDRDGRPESSVKYHLYRYEPRPFFYGMLLNEFALIEEPRWNDKDPKAINSPTLFYTIKAIDAAGNESATP